MHDLASLDAIPKRKRAMHHQVNLLLRIQRLEEENKDLRELLAEVKRLPRTVRFGRRIDRVLDDHQRGLTGEMRRRMDLMRAQRCL